MRTGTSVLDPFLVWLARATRVPESSLYYANPHAH